MKAESNRKSLQLYAADMLSNDSLCSRQRQKGFALAATLAIASFSPPVFALDRNTIGERFLLSSSPSLTPASDFPAPDDPTDPVAWFDLGTTLALEENFAASLASYDRALELKPDYADAWSYRGDTLTLLGRAEEAIASYDRALKIESNLYEVWNTRGIQLGWLGRAEEAIASYDRAIAIKPTYAQAWSNRGNALDKLGRAEEALASYDRAAEIDPESPSTWHNRGTTLRKLGRFAEAIQSFQKAADLYSDRGQAFLGRASLNAIAELQALPNE